MTREANSPATIYVGCTWCDSIFQAHPIHEGKPCIWKPYGCNCHREDPEKADRVVEENIKELEASFRRVEKSK